MYVAMVSLTIDAARAPAAAAAFTNEILPRVKSAEGFVGGPVTPEIRREYS